VSFGPDIDELTPDMPGRYVIELAGRARLTVHRDVDGSWWQRAELGWTPGVYNLIFRMYATDGWVRFGFARLARGRVATCVYGPRLTECDLQGGGDRWTGTRLWLGRAESIWWTA
jgi:hypothetical protein